MNKRMNWFILLVMAAAAAMVVLSFLNYRRLRSDLGRVNALLSASRQNWETTAHMNEELLEELQSYRDELRDRKLSMKEDLEKAAERKAEIVQLGTDIERLPSGTEKQRRLTVEWLQYMIDNKQFSDGRVTEQ